MSEHKEASSVEDTEARSAMKLALEALSNITNYEGLADARKVLREALAKQEQGEPVTADEKLARMKSELAYMRAQQEQRSVSEHMGEPVAWTLLLVGEHNGIVGKAGYTFENHPDHYKRVDVYTTPQQRTWVGLTDDEVDEISGSFDYRYDVARATETKLKAKNERLEKNT